MRTQDQLATEIGSMTLENALTQVQWALLRIRDEMADLGIRLDSADLNLETVREAKGEGEITVWVVTVAGSIAANTTNTMSMSLRPPTAEVETRQLQEVQDDLVDLSRELFTVVKEAAKSPSIPLEFENGSITVKLVVDKDGSLKVAAPGLLKELLKRVGFDASVTVEGNWVSTSTIVLNYSNAKDEPEISIL